MRILFVASEVHPYSKTGGLADVAGALPTALARRGVSVTTVSPWYANLAGKPQPAANLAAAGTAGPARVGRLSAGGVEHLFVGTPGFERERYYGYKDDVERFARFCRAVPLAAAAVGVRPDVVHLNDWQTGLLAPLLRLTSVPPSQGRAKIVSTIHNLQHQGRWNPREVLAWTGLPDTVVRPDGLEFWGDASCLKAAINYADAVTTVSPTYAREVQTPEHGFGLDGTLRLKGVLGILNGLDTHTWDPATDPHLAHPYAGFEDKAASRVALQDEFGLDRDKPIMGMVTRLADQKGLDLVLAALPALIEGWNLVALGSGEPVYVGALAALGRLAPGRVAFSSSFDEPLAHRIYAGADAFLMPSRFEPCGLSQMVAMRYGTVPVVRRTGGLADTVPESRGYGFDPYEPAALTATLERARREWGTPAFEARARTGMDIDFGWDGPVGQYLDLYRRLAG